MAKLILCQLFLMIGLAQARLLPNIWPIPTTEPNLTYASGHPRSKWSSCRLNYYWNDLAIEKEKLEEQYPPVVDVGYGSPAFMPAQSVLDALVKVANNQSDPNSYKIHQYDRFWGNLQLLRSVAKLYSPLMKRDLDSLKEILITAGSLNSLDLAGRAYINRGDEVIMFEPFYLDYRNFIQLYGGKIVPVPLRLKPGTTGQNSSDLTFSKYELASKITNKTKIIWLNNPNNPTGKIFTLDELSYIGELAKLHDLMILSDEAAQWYLYDNAQHIRIATLPGLYNRTLTLTSGGKTLSNTGWRVAWVIAPEILLYPLAMLLRDGQMSVDTPLQIAFSLAIDEEIKLLGTPQSHFVITTNRATKARDRLVSILRSVGADVMNPSAGYCVCANFTKLIPQIPDISAINDSRPGMRLYKYLLQKHGFATFPTSVFYSDQNVGKAEYVLRLTNFRTDETFNELAQLLPTIFHNV